MPDLELIDAKNAKWDELYEVVCEISDWRVGGYECFAVSKLEDYVQSRIRLLPNYVNKDGGMMDKLRELKDLLTCIENETVTFEGHTDPGAIKDCWKFAHEMIDDIERDINPGFETVEQWEARTGKDYPLDGPVWFRAKNKDYEWVLCTNTIDKKYYSMGEIAIVANENGKPPEDWRMQ